MCILIRWVNNVISAQRKTQSPQGQCHISEHKDCENGLRRWKVVESLYARGRGRNNGAWVEGATWNGGGVGSMSRVAWGSFFVVPHISLSDCLSQSHCEEGQWQGQPLSWRLQDSIKHCGLAGGMDDSKCSLELDPECSLLSLLSTSRTGLSLMQPLRKSNAWKFL